VQGALGELVRRCGRGTLPTVSKMCKRLEDDLIIERKRGGATRLRLIQPEKLLDRLAANYAPPRASKWKRPVAVGGAIQEVKLDALVGPPGDRGAELQVNPPRVPPKGERVGFHAHQTDEALFLEDAPIAIELGGGGAYGHSSRSASDGKRRKTQRRRGLATYQGITSTATIGCVRFLFGADAGERRGGVPIISGRTRDRPEELQVTLRDRVRCPRSSRSSPPTVRSRGRSALRGRRGCTSRGA
jgi:hypothetical protein